LREELLALSGDTGAKSVLQRHRDAVRLLECDDPGVVLDIDQKTDLGRVA
jgi:molybdenum cofactor cytidylyltransferase